MSEQYIEQAKANQGALERLFKGLPGIRDYADKELRRDADKRLREQLALQLIEQKLQLLNLQQQLLQRSGLRHLAVVDRLIQQLQILVDRIRSASYGYSGLFDAVKIQAPQLAALHRFDLGLAAQIGALADTVAATGNAVGEETQLVTALNKLETELAALLRYFGQRQAAVNSPDLLTEAALPPLDPALDEQIAAHLAAVPPATTETK